MSLVWMAQFPLYYIIYILYVYYIYYITCILLYCIIIHTSFFTVDAFFQFRAILVQTNF